MAGTACQEAREGARWLGPQSACGRCSDTACGLGHPSTSLSPTVGEQLLLCNTRWQGPGSEMLVG